MSGLTDLTASVAAVQGDVSTLLTNQQTEEQELATVGTGVTATLALIAQLQAGGPPPDDAALEALSVTLNAADASVKTLATNSAADGATLTGIASSLSAVAPAPAAAPAVKKA